jgi:hypothetical protein
MVPREKKVRLLFCGGVVPMREWHAASPLLWRHFAALGNDFELRCVLPAMAKDSGVERDFNCSFVSPDPGWLRYRRFSPALFRLLTVLRSRQLETEVDQYAGSFQPQIILGVWIPDDLLWLSSRLQRRWKIPRVLFLHDVHGTGHFSRASRLVHGRLMADLASVDLGLAVSRGMAELVVEHGCSKVELLYPVPEAMPCQATEVSKGGDKTSIVYFGSLHGSYTEPLALLAESLEPEKWDLSVTWLGEQTVRSQIEKIRPVHDLGWLKIGDLPELAAKTDVFVVLQSFEPVDRLTTSVNFQSKFTQIAQFGKAVLVVAPPWSSISRWAKEKQATLGRPVVELVEDCSADSMKAALGRLDNRSYRADLGTALREEFRADFDPLMLQKTFENALKNSTPMGAG